MTGRCFVRNAQKINLYNEAMTKQIRHETITQLRIPLSEYDDRHPDHGSNAWINLIGEFHGTKKIPKRTLMRLNIKLSEGTTLSGPIRKNDLENLHRISRLFYTSTNRSKSNIKTINPTLINFQKLQLKNNKNKGGKK